MKKIIMIAFMAALSFSAFAQKFAHVNYAELVQLSPEADKARAQLATSQKEAEETYTSMTVEFQKKYQEYEQKINNWTPAIKETKTKELQDLQQRIQQFQQTIQQELQMQEAKLMQPIQEKAIKVVEKLAKAGGYTYVMDASSFLYVDKATSVDLTAKARRELKIPANRTMESLQKELQAKAQAATGK